MRLQGEITEEVNGDAQHLAESVFGERGKMPDISRVPDEIIDRRYRTAYENQDRSWLIKEAQRDPEQFLAVSRRIGVEDPAKAGAVPLGEAPPPSAPLPPAPAPVLPPAGLPAAVPPVQVAPPVAMPMPAGPMPPMPMPAGPMPPAPLPVQGM